MILLLFSGGSPAATGTYSYFGFLLGGMGAQSTTPAAAAAFYFDRYVVRRRG